METTPSRPWLVAIAASAGGLQALHAVLSAVPPDLNAAFVIVLHRTPTKTSYLEPILRRTTHMRVRTAQENDPIEAGTVYIARPDLHLTVATNQRFQHKDGTRVRGVLSSANPLFESAASVFADRTIAVVLTGSGMDATDGVQTVRTRGGVVIAQEPSTAAHGSMPSAAIRTGAVDFVLPIDAIGPAIASVVGGRTRRKTDSRDRFEFVSRGDLDSEC